MKILDSADVSPHNNVVASKDCLVVINARVYDVTRFLKDHPGGDQVLLDVAGKDASEEFEEAGHGSSARLMLDEYYVGEAATAADADLHVTAPLYHAAIISKTTNTTIIKPVGLLFPILISIAILWLMSIYC